MKWITCEHINVDGVSASWLIKTCVDPAHIAPEGLALRAIAEGFASLGLSDDERLRLEFPVYEALDAYARQRAE